MAAVERFDIEKVAQIFQDSLRDDDDVSMDDYLKAYEEINKYVSRKKNNIIYNNFMYRCLQGYFNELSLFSYCNNVFSFFVYRFFSLIGSVFGFVSSDVRSKIDILTAFRKEPDTEKAEKFVTIKTMMSYEKDGDLFKDTKYVSGSRTLLRLHRGLGEFCDF